MCPMDDQMSANTIHYSPLKVKQIARSGLAAESNAFLVEFDSGFKFRTAPLRIDSSSVVLKMYTDSKCMLDAVTFVNSPTKKRLLMGLRLLR